MCVIKIINILDIFIIYISFYNLYIFYVTDYIMYLIFAVAHRTGEFYIIFYFNLEVQYICEIYISQICV